MVEETQEIGAFFDRVASNRVAPASGSVVALAGAGGAALVEKAAIHTLENRLGADSEKEMIRDVRQSVRNHRSILLSLAASDAEAVDALFAGASDETDQTVLERATGIPLSIADSCSSILEDSLGIITAVDGAVAPDLYSGLWIVYSATLAAVRTVETNLELIEDSSLRSQFEARKNTVLQDLATNVGELEADSSIDFEVSADRSPE
ncbi:cyclodeaminase/cyclohydrolase family protein [Halodesulfurarchaeum sp.]|uniref:cyclodeaminase/cyclohydrolase family protein n=1 Tax=Halodesulfurarchaeum sp. TaxID=1980530 RepID=UPI001BC0FB08|nr:cyclodeaminase/cyclohydrolase family protein [Halodesulfurarchaeum sp.]